MLPLPALIRNAEAACIRNGINLPASTRHSGRMTFQCKVVKVLVFLKKKNYNIIYEVITIEFVSFIFRFTNIEAARVISSAFKSSMEIPLFQWSQISKHPKWMPQINAWFDRFEVGVNYNFQLINIIVNKLLFLFKINYLYTEQILLGQ
jgi:hypothetical protein